MFDMIFRWETLWYLMLILYIPSCVGLIVIVLLQKGKGVGFAGAFGIGAGSDTVFGPRMSKSLPQKLTYVMAAIFMIMAFTMSLVSGRLGKGIAPEKAAETATAPTDLSGLPDLGKAVAGETPGGTVTATPGEPSQGGTVSVTPGEPAKPGEGGTVTVTPGQPAPPGVGGTVSVTPAAPGAPTPQGGTVTVTPTPAPEPPAPAPANPEHKESTPAPAGS